MLYELKVNTSHVHWNVHDIQWCAIRKPWKAAETLPRVIAVKMMALTQGGLILLILLPRLFSPHVSILPSPLASQVGGMRGIREEQRNKKRGN